MDRDTLIQAMVDKHEAVYGAGRQYDSAIAKMGEIDMATMSDVDAVNVIEPFLYDWGNMRRVLKQERFSGWQRRVAQGVRSNSELLKRLQNTDIESEDLDNHRHNIVMLYALFREATSQIASAKTLHLVCPDFFPLWDNAIANALRAELADLAGYRSDTRVRRFSGEDYLRFMEGTKLFMSRHRDAISLLSDKYQQRKLRVVDECFVWAVRRPFFSVF